ncbi:hypothetical protein KY335_00315 [Candidatus Woesearchaeota archaeon]|nr:hypothetical protein [Candidatus Woesearchaeota archaeon]MBW3013665.1 hypothetical protein [Candidatus Woesearchaeota archaeon]
MNTLEKFFTAVLLVVMVSSFVYLLFTINSVDENDAARLLGAAVVEQPHESVKFAVNNDVFQLNELESMDYKNNGRLYRVTLINVNTENYPFCQIIVDGEITDKLHTGETDSILGLNIKIGEIYT